MKITMRVKGLKSGQGFTIIELMIALTVLSVILVMASVIMIQIGHLFTKGVNSANLQNTSRNITTDLSSALQFSGNVPFSCFPPSVLPNPPSPDPQNDRPSPPDLDDQRACAAGSRLFSGLPVPVYSFCIGTTRYSYVLNREMGTDGSKAAADAKTPHVLWRDTMNSPANCKPLDLSVSDVQPDMDSPPGDIKNNGSDLIPPHMRLTRFKMAETSPNSNTFTVDVWLAYGDDDLIQADPADLTGHVACKGDIGQEYCATSFISTTVTRRVE